MIIPTVKTVVMPTPITLTFREHAFSQGVRQEGKVPILFNSSPNEDVAGELSKPSLARYLPDPPP